MFCALWVIQQHPASTQQTPTAPYQVKTCPDTAKYFPGRFKSSPVENPGCRREASETGFLPDAALPLRLLMESAPLGPSQQGL